MSDDGFRGVSFEYDPPKWRRRAFNIVLLVALGVLGRWARSLQEGGHDWGDDFALYIRQALALSGGYVGQVTGDTHFALRHSGWPFTPEAYPWGWPMMLVPVVARWGIDYPKMKLLGTIVLLVFLALYHSVCRRRMGEMAALLIAAAIGVNFFFLSWTNNVLSEFPFMAAMMICFLVFDRYQRSGSLWNPSRRTAIWLGIALACAANIRREGYALPLGIVFAHVIEFVRPMPTMSQWNSGRRLNSVRSVIESSRAFIRKAYVPYATFAAGLVVWQVLLPSDLLPNSKGVKPGNFSANARFYHGIVAEHLGLKDAGDTPIRFASNSNFGEVVGPTLLFFLIFAAVLGVLLRLIVAPRNDGWLIGCLLGVAYVVFAAPFHDGRYFYVLSPWVLYFAAQCIPSAITLARRIVHGAEAAKEIDSRAKHFVRLGSVLRCVILSLVVWSNLPATTHAVDYHRKYSYIENGPESPASKEMFAAVEQFVPTTDVIVFFRSRAMMLYTERRAVQHTDLIRLRSIAQWYMMEKNSNYGQVHIGPEGEGYYGVEKVWESGRWVLWKFVARKVAP